MKITALSSTSQVAPLAMSLLDFYVHNRLGIGQGMQTGLASHGPL